MTALGQLRRFHEEYVHVCLALHYLHADFLTIGSGLGEAIQEAGKGCHCWRLEFRCLKIISFQVQGIAFGFGQFTLFATWCLAFWYGSRVVDQGYCSFGDFFKVMLNLTSCSISELISKALNCLVFSAMISGQIQATAPDAGKANAAARRLYRIIMAQQEKDRTTQFKPQVPLQGNVCRIIMLLLDI